MGPIVSANNRQFRVETLVVQDGRRLGRMTPNKDGYFMALPVAVLGITTRNNTYYDIDTFNRQIQDPSGLFCQRLQGGQLYGEWGHPKISAMSDSEAMARLCDIDENCWSHHFGNIYTGETLANGGTLVLADVCPTGPKKTSLYDNLVSPRMNTAFSLRGITDAEIRGNVSHRKMRKLVTFDAVGAGGYFQASKLFSPSSVSVESVQDSADSSYDISLQNVNMAVFRQAALENFSDTELNELFGTNKISLRKQIITVTTPHEAGSFRGMDVKKLRSHYHDFIKE